ncbi:MAG: hypothetical protein OER86_13600 [Phycisphaerae bacterium]|nr:hypothetical protein [Phycisphaerae bacterium]
MSYHTDEALRGIDGATEAPPRRWSPVTESRPPAETYAPPPIANFTAVGLPATVSDVLSVIGGILLGAVGMIGALDVAGQPWAWAVVLGALVGGTVGWVCRERRWRNLSIGRAGTFYFSDERGRERRIDAEAVRLITAERGLNLTGGAPIAWKRTRVHTATTAPAIRLLLADHPNCFEHMQSLCPHALTIAVNGTVEAPPRPRDFSAERWEQESVQVLSRAFSRRIRRNTLIGLLLLAPAAVLTGFLIHFAGQVEIANVDRLTRAGVGAVVLATGAAILLVHALRLGVRRHALLQRFRRHLQRTPQAPFHLIA